ncbi:aminoacyl-histidine dipeptidase [Saprospira grandis DSM 2844]|uniref:Cytosol non-specific dipeptidase n=1 Tax=Saprospira grandis DSM 2844 TaxID=694433 RepID=J1I5J3_9BACT|nr:aminoacyl-histidine dipeptidase [Saprospira grandis]EJF54050.1 aminoacyl-histidine dipeptidase [Saprospira grandis DSM 2844]
MSQKVAELAPKALWEAFSQLNAVPRPSKKEEAVSAFMREYVSKLGLVAEEDEVGNILVRKPATAGLENRPTILLQSHLDMVHQKNADTDFDFLSQGIEMYVEGDWVKAKGTTLGADNGIGVAAIMALLASSDIPHPPLEALFTIDEETGMTGALGLGPNWLKSDYLLNLDTEDDKELTIGCAGGVDISVAGSYTPMALAKEEDLALKISLKGLSGGHSGMDIIKGLGNANLLLARVLRALSPLSLAQFDGGGLRNAIPREAWAIVVLPKAEAAQYKEQLAALEAELKAEYASTDPSLSLTAEEVALPAIKLGEAEQKALLSAVLATPNGIFRMSPEIEGLVQTSNNLARLLVKNGEYTVLCLCRSSVDTEKWALAESIQGLYELLGADTQLSGSYPGWEPLPASSLVDQMRQFFLDRFEEEPDVNACHAGLECGILGRHYPKMQMISFGPNIRGAHSPDERVQISSVQKFWAYLLDALGQLK